MQSKNTTTFEASPRWEIVAAEVRSRQYRRGAELGVFDGRFCLHIVKNCPTVDMLYAVDAFGDRVPTPRRRSSREKCDCEYCKETRAIRLTQPPYYPQGRFFLDRLRETIELEGLGKRLVPIQGLTAASAAKITDNSLDFLFVDGGHSYEAVNADLVAWRPKLRKSGMIFGHDWHMESVRTAVQDFFGRNAKFMLSEHDHVWAVGMAAHHV